MSELQSPLPCSRRRGSGERAPPPSVQLQPPPPPPPCGGLRPPSEGIARGGGGLRLPGGSKPPMVLGCTESALNPRPPLLGNKPTSQSPKGHPSPQWLQLAGPGESPASASTVTRRGGRGPGRPGPRTRAHAGLQALTGPSAAPGRAGRGPGHPPSSVQSDGVGRRGRGHHPTRGPRGSSRKAP